MIDPTPDEIDFIRRLAARQGEMDLYCRLLNWQTKEELIRAC